MRCSFQATHCQGHSVEFTRCSCQVTHCRGHSVELTRCYFQITQNVKVTVLTSRGVSPKSYIVNVTVLNSRGVSTRSHKMSRSHAEPTRCFFQVIHFHGHNVELTRCSFQVANCVEVTVLNLRGQEWDHQDLDFTCWTTASPHCLIMTSPQPAMTSLRLKMGPRKVCLASGRFHLY